MQSTRLRKVQIVPGDHNSVRAQEGNKVLTQRPLYGTEGNQSASVERPGCEESRQRLCWGVAVWLSVLERIQRQRDTSGKWVTQGQRVHRARPCWVSQTYHTAHYVVI